MTGLTQQQCIEIAATEFASVMGKEKVRAFRTALTSEIQKAAPTTTTVGGNFITLANNAFATVVNRPNYQPTSNGNETDHNFSLSVAFNNNLANRIPPSGLSCGKR